MKICAIMAATAAILLAAGAPASAQGSNQSLRDILNRAQTESERRAVEDLIGRLRSGQPAPGAKQAPAPSPGEAPAAAPSGAALQAPAVPAPAPAAVAQPAPPAVAAPPASSSAEPPAATATSAPGAVVPPAVGDARPAVGGPPPEPVAVGPAGPQTRPFVRREAPPAPAPASEAPPAAAAAPAPETTAATPAAAPLIAPPTIGADAAATAPVGRPIGPAAAFPSGTSDAVMARAPEIARDKGLPTIDVEVLFDHNSAVVTPAAAENLMTLGRALSDPRLAGGKYVLAGHTDAKGGAAYNLGLSQRRSEAVRAFLVEHFRIAPENLIARGFGETRLKTPRNPQGPENRRVQVINWTSEVAGTGPASRRR